MKKIISISLIILFSNYSFSCYSSQPVPPDDTLIFDGQKISSVVNKNADVIQVKVSNPVEERALLRKKMLMTLMLTVAIIIFVIIYVPDEE